MAAVLPDVLERGLVLVFCGTAASTASAAAGAYYANPSNAFWRTIFAVGITPRRFAPSEFQELRALKIGLTDLAKAAVGSDRQLRRSDYDPAALDKKMRAFQPQILAFTSKQAWRAWCGAPPQRAAAYGWQAERIGLTRLYVLPSPSGAARGHWDIAWWRGLAAAYRARLKG